MLLQTCSTRHRHQQGPGAGQACTDEQLRAGIEFAHSRTFARGMELVMVPDRTAAKLAAGLCPKACSLWRQQALTLAIPCLRRAI